MEKFVLSGKAKTVFKLIALKAKMEAEKKEREEKNKGKKD